MWAKFLQTLVINVIIPIVKDLAFMLFNMFKVRQIRKQKEAELKKQLEDDKKRNEDYAKNPSADTFSDSP